MRRLVPTSASLSSTSAGRFLRLCSTINTATTPTTTSTATRGTSGYVADSIREWFNDKYISPYDTGCCPLDVIVLYNPSNHANNVAVQDLLKAWPKLTVVQVTTQGRMPVVGVTDHFSIPEGSFGNMDVFERSYNEFLFKNRVLRQRKVGFYPIWSSMAEDGDLARKVQQIGLHWVGASPTTMDGLGKIEYKTFCQQNDLPTSDFIVLNNQESFSDNEAAVTALAATFWEKVKGSPLENSECFIKSVHGGGGRGTVKASYSKESIETALRRVITETKRMDGIYAEVALDLEGAALYQLEMEVDAGSVVDGGRLVYFNYRNQKMIELGFSEKELVRFLPQEVYEGCYRATEIIAEGSKYDGRGTNEILIAKLPSGEWKYYCSEFNKRIQVEHKALSNLKRYDNGHTFNTVADQVMRSCGYRPPNYKKDLVHHGANAVAHVRLIAPDISQEGQISFPTGVDVEDVVLPAGFDALAHTGKLYADTDAQFGCALVLGANWEKLLGSLKTFSLGTVIQGRNISRDYFHFLQKFFHHDKVANLTLGCNRTFDVLRAENLRESRIFVVNQYLQNSVANVFVNGYRPDAGVPNRNYPTQLQIDRFMKVREELQRAPVCKDTPFLNYLDHLDEDKYYKDLKKTIGKRGGAMVSVFPRDVQQEIGQSESQLITYTCRLLMERLGADCGFIGYEMGGAQYQTAEMSSISSSEVIRLGLLCNMPTFSLTRSHWMNGLEKLNPDEVKWVLEATADVIKNSFYLPPNAKVIPYFPYNFHAGNVPEQDEVTGLMLDAGFTPVPNWIWDPRFDQKQLEGWTRRQIELWNGKKRDGEKRKLHHLRIKNAGQTKEWTCEYVWRTVSIMRSVYKEFYGADEDPIIHIHNHNFNGLASHVGAELFKKAQSEGYRYLVIDAAPPSMTHNNDLVLAKALDLTPEERSNLHKFNEHAHTIWQLTERFRDYPLLRIDPETIWAGGTGSSDITAADKVGIAREDIEDAKVLGAKISGLGGIVTPYSQWSMVIGYTCYNQGLKTFEEVEEHINNGGLLNLPPNILKGLHEFKTLLPKPAHIAKLVENHKKADPKGCFGPPKMKKSVDIFGARSALAEAAPQMAITKDRVARYLSYGNFALKSIKDESQGRDHNWLLRYPEIAYAAAGTMPFGKEFSIFGVPVTFVGREEVPNTAEVIVTFRLEGQWVRVKTQDRAKAAKLTHILDNFTPLADPKNPNHVGAFMPGIVESVSAQVGQVIQEGEPLYAINSMKMVTTYKATAQQAGKVVEKVHVTTGEEIGFKPNEPAPLIILFGEPKE